MRMSITVSPSLLTAAVLCVLYSALYSKNYPNGHSTRNNTGVPPLNDVDVAEVVKCKW